MKNLLYPALLLSAFTSISQAQVPQGINYQAVLRNGSGNLLINQNVEIRFTIHQSAANGAIVYSEEHMLTTNAYGLVSTVIGSGAILSGDFSQIDWLGDDYFLQTEADDGTSGFLDLGTAQLQSVPYALAANKSIVATEMMLDYLLDVDAPTPSTGQVLKWDGTQWVAADDENTTLTAGNGIQIINDTINSLWKDDGSFTTNVGTDPVKIEHANASVAFSYGDIYIVRNNETKWLFYEYPSTGLRFWQQNDDAGNFVNRIPLELKDNGNIDLNGLVTVYNGGLDVYSGGLNVGPFGALSIDQETATPAANTIYGNSTPLAYGYISLTGTILKDYGIASVTNPSTGDYIITLDRAVSGLPVVIVTTSHGSADDEIATFEATSGSNVITVHIVNDDVAHDTDFCIVVFGSGN